MLDTNNTRIVKLAATGAVQKSISLSVPATHIAIRHDSVHVVNGSAAIQIYNEELEVGHSYTVAAGVSTIAISSLLSKRVAATTSGTLYLGSLGDSAADQEITTGVSPVRATAIIGDPRGLALLVVGGSGELIKIPVPEEAFEDSPEGVWQAFLARLAANDVTGALAYCDPRIHDLVLGIFSNASAANLALLPSRVGPLALVERAQTYAFFAAQLSGVEGSTTITFIRDPETRRWLLAGF